MFRRIFSVILLLLLSCEYSHAADFSARAALESTDVYVGETFLFQIQVSGSEDPKQPDLSYVKEFTVEFAGDTQNSSSSITIVNGKVTKDIRTEHIFNYHLTPKKTGTLLIPAIEVRSGNNSAKTSPIVIVARNPIETDYFKLRLKLSKDTCYVGEPVILTVTWYLGKDVKDFRFNLPVISDNRFNFADPKIDKRPGTQYYQIRLGDKQAIGEMGRGVIEDSNYTTITFKKVLMPEESGVIQIEKATVTCRAIGGYSSSRNGSFPDFSDDNLFGHSSRTFYKTFVVPSNSLNLKVKDLPMKGRPSNFSGHIGTYKVETSASPTKANVGDPITLTVTLRGPEYLEHVEIMPLKSQPDFEKYFKIPDERASAEIKDDKKVFTQTIRPLNSLVKEIPSVKLSYFDTEDGEYRITRSEPIPLTINNTKVLTLMDAEGSTELAPMGNDIETWSKGIAFNYEDMSVLEKQYLTPLDCLRVGLWPVLTFSPPLIFIFLLTGVSIHRKRNSDPLKVLARKSYSRLIKSLKDTESASPDMVCELVLDSFREYLGVKLRMPSGGAITFSDVRQKLESMGIEQDIIERLKRMFESCEAGRYAGNTTFKDSTSLINDGVRIAENLEKRLK